jgi:hypothetical protein
VTQPIRFLFDECISRPIVEAQVAQSIALYGADATVAHFLSRYPCGVKDPIWIPEIAKEGGWVIVSMDRGTHSKKSERLPIICRAFRVTHVMLSRGLEKRTMFYRATAIEACWPDLIAAAQEPPGTGYVLSMHHARSTVSFRFRKRTDALPAEDAPFVQRDLRDMWAAE